MITVAPGWHARKAGISTCLRKARKITLVVAAAMVMTATKPFWAKAPSTVNRS
jgi:hypothetical protein